MVFSDKMTDMQVQPQWLSLREAAEELGVHYMTVYRYVRLGLLPATKADSVWQVNRADLDRFATSSSEVTPRGGAPWSERVQARLLAADERGAWQVVEGALASGMNPADIYVDVLGPAMRRIGALWSTGEITVGDEHMATATANRLIGRLGPRFTRRGRSRGTVLAATPAGERHGLGLEMLSDILRGVGFDVVTLGTDVPLESLEHSIKNIDRLRAVCLSSMVTGAEKSLRDAIETVRTHAPSVPILLGGAAIERADMAANLGADAWAPDGLAAVAELDRLVG